MTNQKYLCVLLLICIYNAESQKGCTKKDIKKMQSQHTRLINMIKPLGNDMDILKDGQGNNTKAIQEVKDDIKQMQEEITTLSRPFGNLYFPVARIDNIALGKSASQSSAHHTHSDGWGTADKAVDGRTSGQWGDKTCSHTSGNEPGWWMVDLGQGDLYLIDSVHLFNRQDCCSNVLQNFTIEVSRDGASWTECATIPGELTTPGQANQRWWCQGNVIGRYVRVRKLSMIPGKSHLMLCEVLITGYILAPVINIPL